MIDIGANLAGTSFDADLPEVLARAKKHGVEQIIVTGSDLESSQQAIGLSQAHAGILVATAGIHPHRASSFNSDTRAALQSMLTQECVVAIGETGLDFNRNYSSESEQIASFNAHLELATSIDKPLFLHERDAFETFFSCIKPYPSLCKRAVVHCFTGNREALHAYLELGMYIGITGWICDKKRGRGLRNIVRDIPLERVMIETDAPYLTPNKQQVAPLLAKKHRNEPWTLQYTLAQLAEAMGCDIELLREKTSANTREFFNLPQALV
ncbi:MAG: hydrolase TatD [Pseudomonadales bacterium]|nr:hydrolase TatD [Pseudomonadales bacterium]